MLTRHEFGITLIPPCSMEAVVDVIKDISELSELKALIGKAIPKTSG